MNIVPWAAFAASLFAVVAGGLHLFGRGEQWAVWQRRALWTATGMGAATLLLLLWFFLVIDVSYEYIFLYTSTDVPLRYRIAGVWAGRQGSLALWAFWSILIAAVVSRTWKGHARNVTLLLLTMFAAAFLGATAWQDTFARTSEFFLQQRPGGNGLNPTLQSDFFIIHPPMMFLAYALTNVPAAAALGHVLTGHGKWSDVATHLARWNWILYTAAMGLGGVWAYYTLGFGGYWAWDPVEVANLLPWLALTVYLHAQLHHRKHGHYPTVGPFLAILPFLLTLFSTISTRSGLWVSVHAFTDPTQTFNPDAVGRFQDILAVEGTLAFYVGLLLATFLGFLALWARRLAIERETLRMTMRVLAALLGTVAVWSSLSATTAYAALASLGEFIAGGRAATGLLILALVATMGAALPAFMRNDEGKLKLDLQGLNYAAVLILGLGLLILWLWHMVAANGWSTAFYEVRLPFLALPAIMALTVFMALPFGKKRALRIAGTTLAVATAVGIIWQPFVGFLLAAMVFLMLAADRTRRAAATKMPRNAMLGRSALALGALANILFWINPPSSILGSVHLQWPIQLLAIPSAMLLHRAFRHLAGDTNGMDRTRIVVALLGGFYVAPILAAISWWLEREPAETRYQAARLKQVGLYLVHFAVAVALVGYGTSTYLGDEGVETIALGESALVAGQNVTFLSTAIEGQPVAVYSPQLALDDGIVSGKLRWQPSTGSYYPEPGTLRTWHGDVFVAVDAICTGSCSDFETISAYEQTLQRPQSDVQEVTVSMHTLPGLGLVWLALALFVQGAWMLTHSGIPLSRGSSRKSL